MPRESKPKIVAVDYLMTGFYISRVAAQASEQPYRQHSRSEDPIRSLNQHVVRGVEDIDVGAFARCTRPSVMLDIDNAAIGLKLALRGRFGCSVSSTGMI